MPDTEAAGPRHRDSVAAPYEFVMMTFVNMNSPGLLILPTHRVVHSLASFSRGSLPQFRPQLFRHRRSRRLARRSPRHRHAPRVADAPEPPFSPSLRTAHSSCTTPTPTPPQIFAGLSIRQQSLDVVQLHKVLLENVLHLSEESIRNQQNISYVRDAAEALSHLQGSPRANIVFLMNPCRVQQVRDIAFAGEVMPQKSTDFYPKLLSGLTVYALD